MVCPTNAPVTLPRESGSRDNAWDGRGRKGLGGRGEGR